MYKWNILMTYYFKILRLHRWKKHHGKTTPTLSQFMHFRGFTDSQKMITVEQYCAHLATKGTARSSQYGWKLSCDILNDAFLIQYNIWIICLGCDDDGTMTVNNSFQINLLVYSSTVQSNRLSCLETDKELLDLDTNNNSKSSVTSKHCSYRIINYY